jgi:hypothetical protein
MFIKHQQVFHFLSYSNKLHRYLKLVRNSQHLPLLLLYHQVL